VQAAVLAAIISGAVAVAAIVGSVITTVLTLRRQRNAECQRRRHERHMRLLDSGLKAAVDFLSAADRTSRARQGVDTATRSISNAKPWADDKTYQHFRTSLDEARERASTAVADAENAYTVVRLLIPSATGQARRYLDLCIQANAPPGQRKGRAPTRAEGGRRDDPGGVRRRFAGAGHPLVLGAVLALLAVGTVTHALVTSVRRRRDRAVLKTLGLLRSQLLRVVSWEASALAAAALLAGLPLGVVAARWACALFAASSGVGGNADIPVPIVLATIPVTLLLANTIAAGPGWAAARIRPASVLRSE
jgi:hypothetical protein